MDAVSSERFLSDVYFEALSWSCVMFEFQLKIQNQLQKKWEKGLLSCADFVLIQSMNSVKIKFFGNDNEQQQTTTVLVCYPTNHDLNQVRAQTITVKIKLRLLYT
jgi:hypothetical protein